MTPLQPSPAVEALLAAQPDDWNWGQLLVQRQQEGHEVRHLDDRRRPVAELRPLHVRQLRVLAQNTVEGEFRPLRSAPNLAAGWRCTTDSPAALETVLDEVYPGSVADWFAARSEHPPVTHYREFTNRQTGMYRNTAKLSDAQVALVIRAMCAPACCLKRRLWTIAGGAPDAADAKSTLPCLEPCALMLEFARKAMRIEQEPEQVLNLHSSELASVTGILQSFLKDHSSVGRVADFNSPLNPYRLWLLHEKLKSRSELAEQTECEEE